MLDMVALHVSKNPTLLSMRSELLGRAGFFVVPASSYAEATKVFNDGDFDVVIVCHSIPPGGSQNLSRFCAQSEFLLVVPVAVTDESDSAVDAAILFTDLVWRLPEIARQRQRYQSTRPLPFHLRKEL